MTYGKENVPSPPFQAFPFLQVLDPPVVQRSKIFCISCISPAQCLAYAQYKHDALGLLRGETRSTSRAFFQALWLVWSAYNVFRQGGIQPGISLWVRCTQLRVHVYDS